MVVVGPLNAVGYVIVKLWFPLPLVTVQLKVSPTETDVEAQVKPFTAAHAGIAKRKQRVAKPMLRSMIWQV